MQRRRITLRQQRAVNAEARCAFTDSSHHTHMKPFRASSFEIITIVTRKIDRRVSRGLSNFSASKFGLIELCEFRETLAYMHRYLPLQRLQPTPRRRWSASSLPRVTTSALFVLLSVPKLICVAPHTILKYNARSEQVDERHSEMKLLTPYGRPKRTKA